MAETLITPEGGAGEALTIDAGDGESLALPEGFDLTSAEFQASGDDLVVTAPDGSQVVVEDFYSQDNPPELTGADGAQLSGEMIVQLAEGPAGTDISGGTDSDAPGGAADTMIAADPTVITGTDGEPIGNVENLSGQVFAVRADGARVELNVGDPVYQGDILESGPDGSIGVLLADETTFSMGEDGRMVLDEMIYDPSTQEGSVSMTALQGVFTFVSGQVAKTDPDAMTLDTPVATIGIRGTQVGLDISDGENLNVVLMEEADGFVGEVVVMNDAGAQVLNGANQSTGITGFQVAPTEVQIMDQNDMVVRFDAPLRHLPMLHGNQNDFGLQEQSEGEFLDQEIENLDEESAEALADFETAAGEEEAEEARTEEIAVVGELDQLEILDPFLAAAHQIEIEAPTVEVVHAEDETFVAVTQPPVTEPPVAHGLQRIYGPDGRIIDVPAELIDPVFNHETGKVEAKVEGNFVIDENDPISYDLTASDADNVITTGAGDDGIAGTAGADTLTGSAGADTLEGGAGDDVLFGGLGDDALFGGQGDDFLFAGEGDDYVDGGVGNDTLVGGSGRGNDVYIGGEGTDTLLYSSALEGFDLVINLKDGYATDGVDSIGPWIDFDTLSGIENVISGLGDDIIIGSDADNVLDGSGGDDYIEGGYGDDVLIGGAGDNVLLGGEGDDTAIFDTGLGQYEFAYDGDEIVLTNTATGDTTRLGGIEELVFADGGEFNVFDVAATEDQSQTFDLLVAADVTAGETETLSLGGLPEGSSVMFGEIEILPNAEGIYELSAEQAASITITAPQNYSGDFQAEVWAYDAGGNQIGGALANVDVQAVADMAHIEVSDVSGGEDEDPDVGIYLNIDAGLADTDGSESLSITLSGVPFGAYVLDENGNVVEGQGFAVLTSEYTTTDSAGNEITVALSFEQDPDDGTFTIDSAAEGLTPAQMSEVMGNLRLTPALHHDEDFTVSVEATVTDENGDTESLFTTAGNGAGVDKVTFDVEIFDRADAPILHVEDTVGTEDQLVNLDVSAFTVDQSETMSMSISGIPEGAKFYVEFTPEGGEPLMVQLPVDASGTVTIPSGFIGAPMAIMPPHDSNVDFTLTVTATSYEPDAIEEEFKTAEATATINVDMIGDADTITLEASGQDGFATLEIPLEISAEITDIDGSETISIDIANIPDGAQLSAGTVNADGSVTLTVDQLDGLTITPPEGYHGDITLDVTATTTEDDGDFEIDTGQITFNVDGRAEAPTLVLSDTAGDEDTAIQLDVSVFSNDADDSEVLSVTISDIPEGAVLSAGTVNADGSVTLTPDELDGLTITPPLHSDGDFTLSVTATSTEMAIGEIAETSGTIDVNVAAVADAPNLAPQAASGDEDTAIPLVIDASLVDADGSETLSITISGVPEGADINNGTRNPDGTFTLTPEQLDGLEITPPPGSTDDFELTVTATTTEADGGDTATTIGTLPVTVLDVAEPPTLVLQDNVGFEDNDVPIFIDAAISDETETLSVTISGVPEGASLSAGTDNGDGTWVIMPEDFEGLKISPPPDSNEDFTLTVTAVSTSEDGDIAETTGTIDIDLIGVADRPDLQTGDVEGDGNEAIPLDIQAGLADTDGSETLTIEISNVPDGAVLAAGGIALVPDAEGVYTLTEDQIDSVTVTAPPDTDGDFTLHVVARAEENDGDVAVTSGVINVSVDADAASPPILELGDVQGDEDTAIALDISAAVTDADDVLSITISGVPDGASLSAGTDNGDGSWTLTPEQLDGLSITPPADSDVDFDLTVTATAQDGDDIATTTSTMTVAVAAVADAPSVEAEDGSGDVGQTIELDISSALADTDGSETLSITISEVPDGAIINAGERVDDTTWVLSSDDLEDLTITLPAGASDDFDLSVTSTATEADGGDQAASSVSASINVDPNAVDDTAATDAGMSVGGNVLDNDTGSIDGANSVTDVTFGDVTKSFDNPDDVMTDDNGDYLMIEGDHGTLKMYGDGTYEYTADEGGGGGTGTVGLTGTGSPHSVEEAWSGVETYAFGFGTSFVNEDGRFDPSLADDNVTFNSQGIGVEGTQSGMPVPNQINHDADTGESEALAINLGTEATSAQVQVSNIFTSEDGGERGAWQAYDADGNLVGEGIIDQTTVDFGGSNNVGTLSIDLPGDEAFQYLVFTAIETEHDSNANDSSDYFIRSVEFETGAVNEGDDLFSYTMSDADGDTATANLTLTVENGDVTAEEPVLAVEDATGAEDTAIALDIGAALTDTDGSETLSITVSGVPDGASLSAGTDNGDGSWTLDAGDLDGLSVTPPANSNVDFDLTVTATSTESSSGDTATTSATLTVDVTGVADAPGATASDETGSEDQWIQLNLDSAMSEDVDGSETLSITISGVPEGARLNPGTEIGDGVWTATAAELPSVCILPPENFSGDIALTLNVTTTEDDGDTTTTSQDFTVTVEAVADSPDLDLADAQGLEDTAVALDISAALGDTDGSETLSITISDIPDGVTLSAGTVNPDGSVSLTSDDLDGLSLTAPEHSNADFSLTVTATAADGDDTATTTGTVQVDMVGVADAPTLEAALGEGTPVGGEGDDITIDIDNVTATDSGFTVTGRSVDDDGNLTEASADNISFHTTYPPGFGVAGSASGADSELGFDSHSGTSEQMVVAFDDDVSSVDVSFAWKHGGEDAVYELYKDGVKVGEGTVIGGSDGVDPAITIAADNGAAFDEIVFSAPGTGDDYLINSISFETAGTPEATEYPLDITSNLVDTDGSETLSITVDGLPEGAVLSAGTVNDDGSVTLTPAQLQDLTVTVPNDAQAFSIAVSATSTENDGDTATVTTSVSVAAQDVYAEAPEVTAQDAAGDEDTAIALDIEAALTDTDGSETLSLNISGVPQGAVLSAGTDNGDGSWTLSADQLDGLTVTPPANSNEDFDLTITATSTESATGDTATTTATLSVDVTGVADAGEAIVADETGSEDQWIQLNLDSAMSEDTDGSETLSITISGVPEGARLNPGTELGDGVWSATADQLPSVCILPPENFSGDIALTLNVTTTEDDGDSYTVSEDFTVTVEGVADTPEVDVQIADGVVVNQDELEDYGFNNGSGGAVAGSVYAVALSAALTDTDGSETLSITLGGLPDGVELSAGTDNGDGTWSLPPDGLDGINLYVPADISTDFNITVTAVSTEADTGDSATLVDSAAVDVVDMPSDPSAGSQPSQPSGGSHPSDPSGGSHPSNPSGLDIDGTKGADHLVGGAGDDEIDGRKGDDFIEGAAGDDDIDGGKGDDTIDGGEGDDYIYGNKGDDVLIGGAGDDTLVGGKGDDTLIGGGGNDLLTGGAGADTFIFDSESGHDIITDIFEQDTLVFEGQEFHMDDLILSENDDGDVVVTFDGVDDASVTLQGVTMDDMQNTDGDSGYSVTEDAGKVTIIIDSE